MYVCMYVPHNYLSSHVIANSRFQISYHRALLCGNIAHGCKDTAELNRMTFKSK